MKEAKENREIKRDNKRTKTGENKKSTSTKSIRRKGTSGKNIRNENIERKNTNKQASNTQRKRPNKQLQNQEKKHTSKQSQNQEKKHTSKQSQNQEKRHTSKQLQNQEKRHTSKQSQNQEKKHTSKQIQNIERKRPNNQMQYLEHNYKNRQAQNMGNEYNKQIQNVRNKSNKKVSNVENSYNKQKRGVDRKEMSQNNKQQKKEKKQAKKLEKKNKKLEKKQRRKKSLAWKIFKITMILLLISALVFAGFFTYRVMRNGGGLQGFIAAAVGHDENTLKDLDKIYFLVIGISGCEEDYKLADTIMLCSYDPKVQKASILSIPRDTYVGKNKQKASASYKINAMYRNGENIPGMIKSIENITGIDIDNYIIVDTDALVELVDTIGGVEFDVPIDMKYDDVTQDLHIDLKAGYQKLNGQQAEWLVRFRHNNNGTSYPLSYGDNDLGRMRTQREFIKETMKQTLKPENIFNINKIAQIAFNNIQTNVQFDTIKDYIPYAVNFNVENLKTGTLPGVSELVNGVWIYTINTKQAEQVIEELFADEPEEDENVENTNTIGGNTTRRK